MKTRKKFTREAKITILRELERKKFSTGMSRKRHLSLNALQMETGIQRNPGTAFNGNGNISKPEAKLAESERLIGQLYAENAFLKKVLTSLEAKLQEYQKQREGN